MAPYFSILLVVKPGTIMLTKAINEMMVRKLIEKVFFGRSPIYSALLSMHRNKDLNSDIELIRFGQGGADAFSSLFILDVAT